MSGLDRADLPVPVGGVVGGRYVVTGVLGQGGMGLVLAGRHQQLGERVAIKFLHREHSGHADRFFREARAAARIRSEHVVRIFDVGRLMSGEPYIVMEYLKGEDLSERLERSGPLTLEQAADFLLDVCEALAEAHAAGVVHRDLKPANIFLAKGPGGDDIIKLLDFGVAKVPEAGALTQTATVLGSPVYMSPEQLMASREVDARSDIWSLGVVLYELLTGSLPFNGSSLVELGILVREKPTPSVRALVAELPEGVDAVVGKCLAKDRPQRFSDVGELAEALAPFSSPGAARAVPKIRRVLAEGRSASALASTMPPPSSEPVSSDVDPIPASARVPTDPKVHHRRAVLAGSLVAVSTGAMGPGPAAERSAPAHRRRALLLIALGLAAAVTGGVLVKVFAGPLAESRALASSTITPTTAPPPDPDAPATTLPTAPIAASTPASPPATPPPSASAVHADEPPTMVGSKTTRRPSGRPSAPTPPSPTVSTSASAAVPAVNCNPPYTIDEHGVRRAKRECL